MGLVLADRLLAPARDAGPKRGVLPSHGASDAASARDKNMKESRVTVSLAPLITSFALRGASRVHEPDRMRNSLRLLPAREPMLRITFQ